MEFFSKAKAVRLRSHHDKYLVADDDQETVRQSRRSGSSRNARWLVELVEGAAAVRLKSCHGRYLAAADAQFLLGMTGRKVLQITSKDSATVWHPVRDGFLVRLRAGDGTYLRGNGGTPPWRNSVTHDNPHTGGTHNWILWDVEEAAIPEDESLTDYLSIISSFSSLSDDFSGLELASPVSVPSGASSPRVSTRKAGMDLFRPAKVVRLRSHHNKYLHADDDEESVRQTRSGSSKSVRWTVEFVEGVDNVIRLKSCYGKYLTASNQDFLLGMTGRKVLQTVPPGRLDSSVEWEPIRDGYGSPVVKLKTRYGNFLRANGGVPPWRNSVTHDVPHRSVTQDWVLWEVNVVELLVQPPNSLACVWPNPHSDSLASESTSPSTNSPKSPSFGRQESSDSMDALPKASADGRTIYYHVADDYDNVNEEDLEGHCIMFKGNGVDELRYRLEQETGLQGIIVCSRSPLNGNLYPLRLQLPPNNMTMHVVIIESSSKVARNLAKPEIPL